MHKYKKYRIFLEIQKLLFLKNKKIFICLPLLLNLKLFEMSSNFLEFDLLQILEVKEFHKIIGVVLIMRVYRGGQQS